MTSQSLAVAGREAADEVRDDIKAGKVVSQIGYKLTYFDGTDPNTLYPGTLWIITATYTTPGTPSYNAVDWVRKE
jgi:hypothetical protein